MEKIPITQESSENYFENYEVKSDDLESIQSGADLLIESGLFEANVTDNLRIVTYDSKNFYIFTRGEHSSTDKVKVEELPSSSKKGFRVFKIENSGPIGRKKGDYRDARGWLLRDEIESTAVNAKKFPNKNVLCQPNLPQPKEILDVISMAPKEPFEKFHMGKYDYLTDVIFHETGHIEQRRLENWHEGEGYVDVFPSDKQREEFKSAIQKTNIFPEEITGLIIKGAGKKAVNEMYAMIVNREAARQYKPEKIQKENTEFSKMMEKIKNGEKIVEKKFLKELVDRPHNIGRSLAIILEEQFPDFLERKKFVHHILTRLNSHASKL